MIINGCKHYHICGDTKNILSNEFEIDLTFSFGNVKLSSFLHSADVHLFVWELLPIDICFSEVY